MKSFLLCMVLVAFLQAQCRADCIDQYKAAAAEKEIFIQKEIKKLPLTMLEAAAFFAAITYFGMVTSDDGFPEQWDRSEFILANAAIGASLAAVRVVAVEIIQKNNLLEMAQLLEESKFDLSEKPLTQKVLKKIKRKHLFNGSIDELSLILNAGNEAEAFCDQGSIRQLVHFMEQ